MLALMDPLLPSLPSEERRSKEQRQEGADVPVGTVEEWLEKRAKRLRLAQSNRYVQLGAILLRRVNKALLLSCLPQS